MATRTCKKRRASDETAVMATSGSNQGHHVVGGRAEIQIDNKSVLRNAEILHVLTGCRCSRTDCQAPQSQCP